MPLFDLHTHSTASDGTLSPEGLVSRAKERGVDTLALTDHDTVAGIGIALQASKSLGLHLVPGIELSSQWKGLGIHILGLNIDHTHPAMTRAQTQQRETREERAVLIDTRLQKIGVSGALAGARALAGDAVLGRPHFAQYLINVGYVNSMNLAFKQYLGAGKAGDIKHLWPEMATVIEWIRMAGGVAVLAHPSKYKLTNAKLRRLIGDFSDMGGQGIEVISGSQESQITQNLTRIANDFDLCASCGSDFHGPGAPWHELGAFDNLPTSCQPIWQLWH